jgi:hypothetical protein
MTYVAGDFDSAHHYVQWGGTLPGGDDWSCGLRMTPVGAGTATNDPAMMTGVAAAIEAFHAAAGAQVGPGAKLTFSKMNAVGVDGHYLSLLTQEHVHASVAGGGSGANTPANQIALVVTLETGFARGPAHRGRFYLPLPMITPGSDGRIATGSRDPVVTAAAAFLTALNAVSAGAKVGVYSRKSGAAAHRIVTSMSVGRVLDTQRRRRNKLVEAY